MLELSPFKREMTVLEEESVIQLKFPTPSVCRYWLAVPSALGSVHSTLEEIVSGARKPTVLVPLAASSIHCMSPACPAAVPIGLIEVIWGKQLESSGPQGTALPAETTPGSVTDPSAKGAAGLAAEADGMSATVANWLTSIIVTNKAENPFETYPYHFNMSGARGEDDYTYSEYFIGRTEQLFWRSQQLAIRDGGFKVGTDLLAARTGRTDDWLIASNFTTTVPDNINPLSVLPFKIPSTSTWAPGVPSTLRVASFLTASKLAEMVLVSPSFRSTHSEYVEKSVFLTSTKWRPN